MKKCKNCQSKDAIKYSKYSNGNFCSSKCARSFSTKEKRKEINEKLSNKLKGKPTGINRFNNFSKEKWKEINEKRKEYWKNKLFNTNFNDLGVDSKRNKVILEQNEQCNKCKLSKWLDEKITLELEHIDGNHQNNKRENLEALCPNCHSLTPTWRGRNKQNNKRKINDEELLMALIDYNFNMRQALISVGLAAKGGNYCRCHKLKKEYENTFVAQLVE